MVTLDCNVSEAYNALLAKIAKNLAWELTQAATSAASAGPDMAPNGGTPSLMRENCLRSELAYIRRIEKMLVEALQEAGVIVPPAKEIKRK